MVVHPDNARQRSVSAENSAEAGKSVLLKYTSLALLTLQNAALILVMRYVRTRPGDMFLASTAVIMAEVFKLVVCVAIVTGQEGGVRGMLRHLYVNIVLQPIDCLKISVPAVIYMIQNNLLYVALSNLEATTFQITYQLKILTTALFSVTMLRKRLSTMQWISLVLLFVGVAIVQLDSAQSQGIPAYKNASLVAPGAGSGSKVGATNPGSNTGPSSASRPVTVGSNPGQDTPVQSLMESAPALEQNYLLGLGVVILSACMSGYAGIYFERLLKQTSQTLSVRNVQLCLVGILVGVVGMLMSDGKKVLEKGFFFGYDPIVWLVVLLNSIGGLTTALVVRYADNILKGFATSCAIILSCILSIVVFSFQLSTVFSIGASLVVLSVFMYSKYQPRSPLAKVDKSKTE